GAHGIWRALLLRLILPDWPNEVESAKLVFDDKGHWRRPRDALRGRAHLVQNCQPKLSERPHRTNRSNEQALPGVAAVAAMRLWRRVVPLFLVVGLRWLPRRPALGDVFEACEEEVPTLRMHRHSFVGQSTMDEMEPRAAVGRLEIDLHRAGSRRD